MSDIIYLEPAKVVREILKNQLGLTDDRIMFTNQKNFIPTDGLYVNVSYVGPGKVIGPVTEWVDDGAGGLTEKLSMTMTDMIQIDILGMNNEPRTRRNDIVLALASIYSEMQQEKYGMQLARQPMSFLDTSFVEETKMVTRYTTTIFVTSIYQKDQPLGDFYIDFSRAVPPLLAANQ